MAAVTHLTNIHGEAIFPEAEVSPKSLASLIKKAASCSAAPDEIALLAQLKDECLTAHLLANGAAKFRRGPFLQKFFECGDTDQVATEAQRTQRAIQLWVADFCVYATGWLIRQAEYRRDDEARDLQCSEACGRKHFDGTTGGDKRTSGAKTKKLDRPNWTRCMDCPRRRDDVAVAMRGPGTAPAETGR